MAAILSGLLCALSLPVVLVTPWASYPLPDMGWLAWAALVPLYSALAKTESRAAAFRKGFAFGAVFLDSDSSESGFSFALPIRVAPVSFASLEYRPTWGWINENTISDEDLALCVGVRYVSLRAGYRWTKVQSTTLDGPIVGVLLSW